jgi:hypothetical protein
LLDEAVKADVEQPVSTMHSAPLFESQGFKVVRVTKDGKAEGLDRVELTMTLTVCP